MQQTAISRRGFDIVIFVATDDEHTAVLEDGHWDVEHDAYNNMIHVKCLMTREHYIIRLALKKLSAMGAEACVFEVSQFLGAHPCRLVTMVGVCAGIPTKVKRCDIVIPGKVMSICNGKETEDANKQRVLLPSNRSHNLNSELLKAVGRFQTDQWKNVETEILKIDNIPSTPVLRYGLDITMAQVFHVRAYSGSDKDLKKYADRNVHALEMESAALAYAASKFNALWIVIKGVQDLANLKKNDKYRPFCAWASYRTLKEFVTSCLDDYWRKEKVHIVDQGQSEQMHNEDTKTLICAYRSGNYDLAFQTGKIAFETRPYDKEIWPTYLNVLMRRGEYEKARDVIDAADFYIQQQKSADEHFRYRVIRAEYYWRVGSLEDARRLLHLLISTMTKYKDDRIVASTLAQAWYVKGMVYLASYRKLLNINDLKEAKYCLQMAVRFDECLNGTRYWVFIHLLLVSHLLDRRWDEALVRKAKDRLQLALDDFNQRRRPAPRIYRLRLAALTVAAGKSTFHELKTIIREDKKSLSKQLILPPDFFREFEEDCRLIFGSSLNKRDHLLSLIYDWASVVRKAINAA